MWDKALGMKDCDAEEKRAIRDEVRLVLVVLVVVQRRF
jgi:hypothetical protein